MAENEDSYVGMVRELVNGPTSNVVILAITALLLFGLWLWNRKRDRDAQESLAQAKRERGRVLEQKLGAIADVVELQVQQSQAVSAVLAKVAGRLESRLTRRASQAIMDDTLQFLQRGFADLTREVALQNEYRRRPEFVADAVRTGFADLLSERERWLKSLPLAINPAPYFVQELGEGGRRYLLVDRAWNALVTVLTKPGLRPDLAAQEAVLAVRNVLNDYWASSAQKATRPVWLTPLNGVPALNLDRLLTEDEESGLTPPSDEKDS